MFRSFRPRRFSKVPALSPVVRPALKRAVFAVCDLLEERRMMSAAKAVVSSDAFQATLETAFSGDADRVSSDLLTSYLKVKSVKKTSAVKKALAATVQTPTKKNPGITYLSDSAGRMGVVITADDPDALVPTLESLGMVVGATLPSYHRIEGYLPLSALPAISNLGDQGLLGIVSVPKPKLYTGTVNSQADNVLESDRVRSTVAGATGAGVKIGVLSDSYDKSSLVTRASVGISSGNLPNNVQVLQDFNSSGTSNAVADEGRAMLELIYDVAPGATLAFATADISEAQFAANIQNLANAGYNVISDDVFYYDEPYFQDGIVAQAVNNVVTNNGVSYFSSAGNQGSDAYDSAASTAYGSDALNFASDTIPVISASASSYYDWNASSATTDTQMSVSISRNSVVNLNFQWDQPYYTTTGVTTNLDFYLVSTNTSTGVSTLRAQSTTNNVTNQTPFSQVVYQNTLSTSVAAVTTFNIVVRNTNGGPIPGRIKFVDFQGDAAVTYNEYFTHSGTVVGHAAAANAMAVGAAAFYQQTTPESFSSTGPTAILFNIDGTRKATAEVRAKPDILAIDATDTSFFYPGGDIDGNGLNNFSGTSAAAPHAAAVAALLKQANPSLTPAQIYAQLKATADATVGNGDPNVIGAGLINAYRAIYGTAQPTALTLSDGFESGTLSSAWQTYKSGSGFAQASTAQSPISGSYQLLLGSNLGFASTGFGLPGLSEEILHVDLAGKTGVQLSFSEKKLGSEVDAPMPASFTGHGNYTGVSFSVNGTTWYRLVSLDGANSTTSAQTLVADISAAALAAGVALTSDTKIKFQEYHAQSFATSARSIALDNISVSQRTSVSSIVVDSGAAQRSRVRSITINFSGPVDIGSAAFSLVRTEDGAVIPLTTTLSGGNTQAVLTFGGATLDSGSLGDGRYTLTLDGSAIIGAGGRAADVDGNGTDGGTSNLSFFRFFGDATGNAITDGTDYVSFLAAYNSGNATGANSAFDFNNDGLFTHDDLDAFLVRFNTRRLI